MDALASLWADYIFSGKRPDSQLNMFPEAFKKKVNDLIDQKKRDEENEADDSEKV